MLKKLMKYDLEYMFKGLFMMYGASLIMVIFTRISFLFKESTITTLIMTAGIALSLLFGFATILFTFLRAWMRFKQNLFGDEAYLTHTLPVEKNKIYLSKFLMGIIGMVSSCIVIVVMVVIVFLDKEVIKSIKNLIISIQNGESITNLIMLCMVLFVMLLQFLNTMQVGYTGIILGHRKNNNKIVLSVVFGYLVYIATQFMVLISMIIMAAFNSNIKEAFMNNDTDNTSIVSSVLVSAMFTYVVIGICLYFINRKLLKKGINLE